MSGIEFAREASREKSDSYDEKAASSDDSSSAYNVKADVRALDVAVELAAGHTDDTEISPEEFRRLRFKLDKHILPLLGFIYAGMFCFRDIRLPK